MLRLVFFALVCFTLANVKGQGCDNPSGCEPPDMYIPECDNPSGCEPPDMYIPECENPSGCVPPEIHVPECGGPSGCEPPEIFEPIKPEVFHPLGAPEPAPTPTVCEPPPMPLPQMPEIAICPFPEITPPEIVKRPSFCHEPAETGMCRAAFRHFFFNDKTGKCETFTYGGCGGNENNFKTLEECQKTCGGVSVPTPVIQPQPRPLPVLSAPKAVDCNAPKVVGRCRAAMPSYWYNAKTNKCEKFIYGGCGGNSNNFRSLAECEKQCKKQPVIAVCPFPRVPAPKVVKRPSFCHEPAETGMCRAAFRHFFFNDKTGKCETFTYGGCGGNKNNFKTLEECKKTCGGVSVPQVSVCAPPPIAPPVAVVVPIGMNKRGKCMEPKKVGPGRARMTRYYYNQEKNRCYRFYFGGMGANGNNFKSRKECTKECRVAPKPRCRHPKSYGHGKARMMRYYYHERNNKCYRFPYKGAGGNDNRFRSRMECLNYCKIN